MDKFLKRRLINYIKILLPHIKNNYHFRQFTEELNCFCDITIKIGDKKAILSNFPAISQGIYTDLNLKITENVFLVIKKIYSLSDIEYELFLLKYLEKEEELCRELLKSCDDYLRILANDYYKCTYAECRDARNNLRKKGLINAGELNTNLRNILTIGDYSKKTIKSMLLGSPLKAKLKLKNYSHLKGEAEIIKQILKNSVPNKTQGINIMLYGGVGAGKTEFAKLIAKESGLTLYSVATTMDDDNIELNRDGRLSDFASKQHILSLTRKNCILFDEAEDAMRGFSFYSKNSSSKGYLNKLLEETPVPVIWTTNNIEDVDPAFLRRMTYSVEFKELSEEQRLAIWKQVLKENNYSIDTNKLATLNKKYNIQPSLIVNAVNTTKMISGSEDDFETFIETAAKLVSKKRAVVDNTKVFDSNKYNKELVNTDIDVIKLAQNIKSTRNLNFSLCLYGEPGTGKSHYAKYLANELGIKVICKRSSDLMSMWVGGTERNIAEAFKKAKEEKAMLIFDEADSFLQNRNNAIRSWEVSQVNEMLTWMESHEYPFVCTTNLMSSLDEASLRRFTFKVRFDFLTQEQVNKGIEHFFGIKNANCYIKGLTAGDFATVKKKAEFLGENDLKSICSMLKDEAKLKQSETLKNSVGF